MEEQSRLYRLSCEFRLPIIDAGTPGQVEIFPRIYFQFGHEFGELPRLANLVLLDDDAEMLRQPLLHLRLLVQLHFGANELRLRTFVLFPARAKLETGVNKSGKSALTLVDRR